MPKRKAPPIPQEEQSKRFVEMARAIEADGGLNPTDAMDALERVLAKAAPKKGAAE